MVSSHRLATARGAVKPPRDRHWLHKTSLSNLSVCGLVTAAVLLVTMFEWNFQRLVQIHAVANSREWLSHLEGGHDGSNRRRLSAAKAAEEEAGGGEEPAARLWGNHLLMVLDEGGKSTALQQELRQELAKVCHQVAVTWHSGSGAAVVAAAFGVVSLPAIVYQPPNCAEREKPRDDCRHQVYEILRGETLNPVAVTKWFVSIAPAAIHLANDREEEVEFVEHLPGGEERARVKHPPAGRVWMPTELLAVWTAIAANGTTMTTYTVMGDGAFVLRRDTECNFFTELGCSVAPDTFELTPDLEAERQMSTENRLAMMASQPPTVKNYTVSGYEKRPTPPGLLAVLQDYFERHKADYTRERFPKSDSLSNHRDVSSLHVDLPEVGPLRPSVFSLMHEELEAWSGVRLKDVAAYGIRVYQRGCTLANHVDRAGTHIISAIINVAQQVEKPWPVDVMDHQGQFHSIPLVPGEMALYEGASCPHGRQAPLEGDFYANVFIHMTPE